MSKILERELDIDGQPIVTVMGAEVSPTNEHVAVKVSVLPDNFGERVMKELKRRLYDIQQIFNRSMRIRPVPKIRFDLDTTESVAARVEKLIESGLE